MTDKRFELKWRDTGEVLYDNETGLEHGIYSPNYRFHVRDMMNELHEKNKKLEQQLRIHKDDYLETLNDLERAYENNEKALNNIERLEEENERLKEQVNEMIDIFNDSGLDYHISDELEEILND